MCVCVCVCVCVFLGGDGHVFLMLMRDEDEESGCLMLTLYYSKPCDTTFTILNVNAVRYLVMNMYLLVLFLSKLYIEMNFRKFS